VGLLHTVFLGVVRGKRHLRLFFQTVTNPGGQICSYEAVQVLIEAKQEPAIAASFTDQIFLVREKIAIPKTFAAPILSLPNIEIVLCMEARPLAFPNHGHFILLSARLFPSPRRSASRDSCHPSSAIDLAAFEPRS
jgi:hypothetical protein